MLEIQAKHIATGLMFGEGIRWTGSSIVLSDMLERKVVNVDVHSGQVTTLVEMAFAARCGVVVSGSYGGRSARCCGGGRPHRCRP